MGNLDGRRIIVTGGAGGIGNAAVRLFAAEGARVACTFNNAEPDAPPGVHTARCNIADRAEVYRVFERFAETLGGLDVLVHAAGKHGSQAAELVDEQGVYLGRFIRHAIVFDRLFRFTITQDEKDSATMAVRLSQGGLGLPGRDFYFNPEAGVVNIRSAYVQHISRALALLGRDRSEAQAAALKVMAFETALAKASRTLEDRRDPESNYHKMAPSALTAT